MFLERYMRIFGITQGEVNEDAEQVSKLSCTLCLKVARQPEYLKYRAS